MAKGSVRKKGKKWYYRFYIEDESGNRFAVNFSHAAAETDAADLMGSTGGWAAGDVDARKHAIGKVPFL